MIRFLINIYTWIVLADVILSYMPQYQHYQWARMVNKLAGYSLNPVRKILPPDLPFDFSPENFGDNKVVQTILNHVDVTIHRKSDLCRKDLPFRKSKTRL